MNISIFGLGDVGTVSLGCLARDGHRVIGVDLDPTKQALIRAGKTPIIEADMQELIAHGVKSGRIEVTDDAVDAVHRTDLSFMCVGTPARPNGSQDLAAIERLSTQLGDALKTKHDHHLVVIRSTVFPGTVEGVIQPLLETHAGKRAGVDFSLCFQPEFLREGSSIRDYDHPPYTVVGAESEYAVDIMREVFGHLPGSFISTSIRTAEMLKYTCNMFHTLKVTFANEVGRLCQASGVNSHEVMDLACRDTHLNISTAYLRPGFAFGGSCLSKDLQAMLYMAKSSDVVAPMLAGILPSNQLHIEHAIDMVLATGKKTIGMIGLSFKSGTDDLRESPLVVMAERFIGKGLNLCIYDPEVNLSRLVGVNKRFIEESIPHIASLMTESCEDLVEGAEVIIVGLNDKALLDMLYQKTREQHLILDLVKIPHREKLRGQYQGLCW